MKCTDYIEFDTEKLVQNATLKIFYTGKLKNSDEDSELYIRYGYGPLWENLQEVKLTRQDDTYEAELLFLEYGNVYYCFRDNKNNWDNNEGNNYQIAVEKDENLFAHEEPNVLLPIEVPKLKKGYLIRKKIKITFIKAFRFISKVFKRKDKTEFDF